MKVSNAIRRALSAALAAVLAAGMIPSAAFAQAGESASGLASVALTSAVSALAQSGSSADTGSSSGTGSYANAALGFDDLAVDASGTVEVWRLYNPATSEHLWTTSKHEYEVLSTEQGWNGEGQG